VNWAVAAVEVAKPWYVLARAVDYTGTVLFLGGTAFLAFLWSDGADTRRCRGLLALGWALGLLGTLAGLGFEAAWVAGLPPTAAFDSAVVHDVLTTGFGRVWVARALLWVLAGVVLVGLARGGAAAARSLAWRVGAGAVALGILRTSGMTGHTADLAGSWWVPVVLLLHLLAVCLWVGGLAVLLFGVLPGREPLVLAEVLPRYSRLAQGSVAVIAIAGGLLAWRLVGWPPRLFDSGYGRTLVVKLALFGALLAVGLTSKRWVDRRLATADVAAVRPFVYSVAIETVLAVAVLGAAAFLVTASPGR
jgi:copper transport protein